MSFIPAIRLSAINLYVYMSNSWLIGDRFCDIAAGQSGGVNSNILVRTGHAGHDEDLFEEKPDFVVESIVEACNLILERSGEE